MIGNSEELGEWTKVNVLLKWSQGHVWKLADPLKLRNPGLSYKYIVVRGDNIDRWEACENHEIDLDN